jgi:hypothetical protein
MLHEKWLVETNEMLTLDTKNADPYKSKSTWRMNTRTVMEDASMQPIHHKARHTVINVEDIKKNRKTSKVLSDKLPVPQLLKTPCFHEPLSSILIFKTAP